MQADFEHATTPVDVRALLLALGYRDADTRQHSERVVQLAVFVGRYWGLDREQLQVLQLAATFHDIGKVGIADAILLNPGPLDTAEWDSMKRHSIMGEEIMRATELEHSGQVARVIRHHHEHVDGSGYPDGLAGEDIPIQARIISITDSYDAMCVTRAYHQARSHEQAMAVIHRETGSKHDPQVVDCFERAFAAATLPDIQCACCE